MAPSELKIVGTTTPDAHPGFWQARSEFLGLHGAVWDMIRRTRRGPIQAFLWRGHSGRDN
jgi:hypothetical protein